MYSVWRTVHGAGSARVVPPGRCIVAVVPGANSSVLARAPAPSLWALARATVHAAAAGGFRTTPTGSAWTSRTSSAPL